MRLLQRHATPCPEIGQGLVERIGRLEPAHGEQRVITVGEFRNAKGESLLKWAELQCGHHVHRIRVPPIGATVICRQCAASAIAPRSTWQRLTDWLRQRRRKRRRGTPVA